MSLAPTSACVVGVGGLGCPASLALALAGVDRLTLIDPDVVDLTNLHRQPWHHPRDVGTPKVTSAAAKLAAQFPSMRLDARQERVELRNVEALFGSHDVVLDCTDGVGTKFLLSDAAVRARGTLVYAGVLRFEGLAMRIQPGGPCLRCLFESPPTDVPTCAQAGVLGAMAGVVGGVQAQLALAPNPDPAAALLHVIDGYELSARVVTVRPRADCAACAPGANPVLIDPDDPTCLTPSTSPARSAP
jgi:adenylyltransferase/sulfurtransferase